MTFLNTWLALSCTLGIGWTLGMGKPLWLTILFAVGLVFFYRKVERAFFEADTKD